MSICVDENFAYDIASTAKRTLKIVGVNPGKYNASNLNWGAFPTINLVYTGPTVPYSGVGSDNAYTIAEIADSAFYNGANQNPFTEGTLTLTSNIVRIGSNAFNGIKLTGVLIIPSSVTYLGDQAFSNTLMDEIVFENESNSDLLGGVVDLTGVLSKNKAARIASDNVLNTLKVTKANPTFTGVTTIPTAIISNATIASATTKVANVAKATLVTANIDYYEANVSDALKNSRFQIGSVAGNLLSVNGVNETAGPIEIALTSRVYRTGTDLVSEIYAQLNAKNIAWVGGSNIAWGGTSFDPIANTVKLGYSTDAPASVISANSNPGLVIRTKFMKSSVAYDSSRLLGAVGATVGSNYEDGAFVLAYGNRNGLSFPQSVNLNTPTLTVTGDASFSGSVSVSGQWNYMVQPKYSGIVLATKSYVDSKISIINGNTSGLTSTMNALTKIVSAIGEDSNFAMHVSQSQSIIAQTISNNLVARTSQIASLSSALSASALSLQTVDATMSTGIASNIVGRSSQIASLSSALSTATLSLQTADTSISTGIASDVTLRISQNASLSSALSTSVSDLQAKDVAISSGIASDILRRSIDVGSVSTSLYDTVSALQSVNVSLSSGIVSASTARSTAVSSVSVILSSAVPLLQTADTAFSTALSARTSDRVAAITSLSTAIASQAVVLQAVNSTILPQISGGGLSQDGTTGTVFNLLRVNVGDSLTFLRSGGSGTFSNGQSITVLYSATDYLKGTVTNVNGSNVTFTVTFKATSAVETQIYSTSGSSGPTALLSPGNYIAPLSSPAFVASSNYVITAMNATVYWAGGAGTYYINLLNGSNATLARSVGNEPYDSSQTSKWLVFDTAFVPQNQTLKQQLVFTGSANIIVNFADMGAYTTLKGYAVPYSSGVVQIDVAGTAQADRIATVSSLSLGVASMLASQLIANSTISTAIFNAFSARSSAITLLSTDESASVSSLQSVSMTGSTTQSTAVSNRSTNVVSLATSLSENMSSLTSVNVSNSTRLSAEIVNRTTQVTSAVNSLVNGAPSSLDTLFEIANALTAGPAMYSTISNTNTSLSTEVTARSSQIASLSSTLSGSVLALQTVDTTLSTVNASNTVARNSQIASLSSTLSGSVLALQTVDTTLSTVNASNTVARNSQIASLSGALSGSALSLQTVDTTLSTVNASNTAARNSQIASLSDSIVGVVSTQALFTSSISSAISANTSTRTLAVSSLSSSLSTLVSGLSTADTSLVNAFTTLSNGTQLSTLANLTQVDASVAGLMGISNITALDTLGKIASAINLQPDIGTVLTSMTNAKGDVTSVSSISTAATFKATQFNLSQLSDAVGLKVSVSTTTSLQTVISGLSTSLGVLQTDVTSLISSTAVNTIVTGDIIQTTRDLDELYVKNGFVNPDGSVNYKINNLADPVINPGSSSALAFVIDGNYAVTAVRQVAAVLFDSLQTNVKYTSRGVEYTLSSSTFTNGVYTFSIESNSIADYSNNATAIVVTGQETAIRLAPLHALTIPKLALSSYTYATPTVSTPYAATTWNDATGQITQVLQFNFESGVKTLRVDGTNYDVTGTTSKTISLVYLAGADQGSALSAKALSSTSKTESATTLTLTNVYNDYPQYAVPTLVGGSKTISLSGSTCTYSATFSSDANVVELHAYDAGTSTYSKVQDLTPVTANQFSVSRTYDVSRIGQPLFKLKAATSASKRSSDFSTVGLCEPFSFPPAVISGNLSYTNLNTDPKSFSVSATYTVHPLATVVQVINSGTSGILVSPNPTVNSGSVTFTFNFTEAQAMAGMSFYVKTNTNSVGLESSSVAQVLKSQHDVPVLVTNSKIIQAPENINTTNTVFNLLKITTGDSLTFVKNAGTFTVGAAINIVYSATDYVKGTVSAVSGNSITFTVTEKATSAVNSTIYAATQSSAGTVGPHSTFILNLNTPVIDRTNNFVVYSIIIGTYGGNGSNTMRLKILDSANRVISTSLYDAVYYQSPSMIPQQYFNDAFVSANQPFKIQIVANGTLQVYVTSNDVTSASYLFIDGYFTSYDRGVVYGGVINPLIAISSVPSFPYTVSNFPTLGGRYKPAWDMSVYFKATGGAGLWRAIVGAMYYNAGPTGRDWGIWINQFNNIHWAWPVGDIYSTLAVALNVNYCLKITKSATTITFALKNMDDASIPITQTVNLDDNSILGITGQVTVGGWLQNNGENFVGTISGVYVGSYTHAANYASASTAGINVYDSTGAFIKNATTPGAGTFALTQTYDASRFGQTAFKLSSNVDSSKRESAGLSVVGDDVSPFPMPVLQNSVSYVKNGSVYTASLTYVLANTTRVTAVRILNASDSITPVTNSTTQSVSVSNGNVVALITVDFTTPLSIVVVAEANPYGKQGTTSSQQALLGQYDAPVIVAGTKVISLAGSTYTYTANYTSASTTGIKVYDSAGTTLLQTVTTPGPGTFTVTQTYDASNVGQTAFRLSSNLDSSYRESAVLNVTGEALPQFPVPVLQGSISYTKNGSTYTASLTYLLTGTTRVSALSILNASDGITAIGNVTTQSVFTSNGNTTASITVEFTTQVGIVVKAVANQYGSIGAASTVQTLMVQHDAPVLVAGSKVISLSGSTYTHTANYTSASTSGIKVYDSAGTTLLQTVTTPGSGTFTVTQTYDASNVGQTAFKLYSNADSSKRESEVLNVTGEALPQFPTPVLQGSISYAKNGSTYTASLTYLITGSIRVSALSILNASDSITAISNATTQSVSTSSGNTTVLVTVDFTTPFSIVVKAVANAYGTISVASTAQTLQGQYDAPVIVAGTKAVSSSIQMFPVYTTGAINTNNSFIPSNVSMTNSANYPVMLSVTFNLSSFASSGGCIIGKYLLGGSSDYFIYWDITPFGNGVGVVFRMATGNGTQTTNTNISGDTLLNGVDYTLSMKRTNDTSLTFKIVNATTNAVVCADQTYTFSSTRLNNYLITDAGLSIGYANSVYAEIYYSVNQLVGYVKNVKIEKNMQVLNYTANYTSASTAGIKVYDSAGTTLLQTVTTPGSGTFTVTQTYDASNVGQTAFLLKSATIATMRESAALTVTGEALPQFPTPVLQGSISYTKNGSTYTASLTYLITGSIRVSALSILNASDGITPVTNATTQSVSTSSENTTVLVTVDFTTPFSIVVKAVANAYGTISVASTAQTLQGQYDAPVIVAGSKVISLSGSTYTHTANYTSASTTGIKVYDSAGTTLLQTVTTPGSGTFTVTQTYDASNVGQTAFRLSSNADSSYRESAALTVTGEALPQFPTPVLQGSISYTKNGSTYTASLTYLITGSIRVSALSILNASDGITAISNATTQSVSTSSGNTTVLVTVDFTTPLSIVVKAVTNAYGTISAASTAQTLQGQYDAPVIVAGTKVISATVPTPFAFSNVSTSFPQTVSNFPAIGSLSTWDMHLYFKSTGGSGWRGIIGAQYYNTIGDGGRDWGLWLTPGNNLNWWWGSGEFAILTVSTNVNYYLKITKTTTTIKFDLTNLDNSITQSSTQSHSNATMGTSGAVTIGSWLYRAETFVGTISSVYVGSYTHTANYTSASTAGIKVYDSAGTTLLQTVTTPGSGTFTVAQTYNASKVGQTAFLLKSATIATMRESAALTVTGEALPQFPTPVLQGSISYAKNGSTYTASLTYLITGSIRVSALSILNASDGITPVTNATTQSVSTSSENTTVLVTVDFTTPFSIVVKAVANAYGTISVASTAQTLQGQYDAPVIVAGTKTISLSGSTYTHTANYTSASTTGIKVYDSAGTTLLQTVTTPGSGTFTVTQTYDASKIGQTAFRLSSNLNSSYRESAIVSVSGEDIPGIGAPTLGTKASADGAYLIPMPNGASTSYGATWVEPGGKLFVQSANTYTNGSQVIGTNFAISADGNKIVIGSPYFDGSNAASTNYGCIQMFSWNGSWTLSGSDSGSAANYKMGEKVAISGDGKIVAASVNVDIGQIKLYNNTSYLATLNGADYSAVSGFGVGISLSGNGRWLALSGNTVTTGHYYLPGYIKVLDISNISNGSYAQWGQDILGPESTYARLGYELIISADGNKLVASTLNYVYGGNNNYNKIIVYAKPSTSSGSWTNIWEKENYDIMWSARQKILTASYDLSTIAFTRIVGSPSAPTTYIYNTTTNTLINSIVRSYAVLSEFVIALSGNGKVIAQFEATSSSSYKVYVYDTASLTQIGNTIENTIDQNAPVAYNWISLSGEGTRLAISVPYGTVANPAGEVSVYQIPRTNYVEYTSSNSILTPIGKTSLIPWDRTTTSGSATITATQYINGISTYTSSGTITLN